MDDGAWERWLGAPGSFAATTTPDMASGSCSAAARPNAATFAALSPTTRQHPSLIRPDRWHPCAAAMRAASSSKDSRSDASCSGACRSVHHPSCCTDTSAIGVTSSLAAVAGTCRCLSLNDSSATAKTNAATSSAAAAVGRTTATTAEAPVLPDGSPPALSVVMNRPLLLSAVSNLIVKPPSGFTLPAAASARAPGVARMTDAGLLAFVRSFA
mmetsp:Transcript_21169/g.65755  ORF Transcript_21169/g.65755 Transcript_21169/m.65755 type:complete len:213 (-) Transcript_21169:147-785(-)